MPNLSAQAAAIPSMDELIFDKEKLREPQPFQVDSLDKANWAVCKIIQAERRIQERNQIADTYKQKINEWLRQSNQEDKKSIDFLTSLLRPFVEQEVAKQKRIRNIKLLGATVGLRKQPEKIEIIDIDLALGFCEENHPEALIIKKELSKTELKKLYGKGEIIPGVLIVRNASEFYIKSDDGNDSGNQ